MDIYWICVWNLPCLICYRRMPRVPSAGWTLKLASHRTRIFWKVHQHAESIIKFKVLLVKPKSFSQITNDTTYKTLQQNCQRTTSCLVLTVSVYKITGIGTKLLLGRLSWSFSVTLHLWCSCLGSRRTSRGVWCWTFLRYFKGFLRIYIFIDSSIKCMSCHYVSETTDYLSPLFWYSEVRENFHHHMMWTVGMCVLRY